MTTHQTGSLAQAERLTIKLASVAESDQESPEAEEIREKLYHAWEALSAEERRQIQRLSAELDLLLGDEVPRPSNASPRKRRNHGPFSARRATIQREVKTAFNRGQWHNLLELMRIDPEAFPEGSRVFLRSHCYHQLGWFESAIAFARYGVRKEPESARHRFLLITTLVSAKRWRELEEEISSVERNRDVRRSILAAAATALAQMLSLDSHGRERSRRLLRLVERVLTAPSDYAAIDLPIKGSALALRAVAHYQLGDVSEAVNSLTEAIGLLPRRGIYYSVRAQLFLRLDEKDKAITDFENAARLGSPLPVPHVALASHHFEREDFLTCLRHTKAALEYPLPDKVRAVLLHLRGICQFELGGSPQGAQRLLMEAITLSPENSALEHNLALLRERASARIKETAGWRLTEAEDTESARQTTMNELLSDVPRELLSGSQLLFV